MSNGKRILLVDDEKDVRLSIKMILETLQGYEVTTAASVAEALPSYAAGRFDLVITDSRMPGAPGAELARQIKAMCPTQPVLMLTAYTQTPRGPENPVDLIWHKPILNMPDFCKTINNLIESGTGGVGTFPAKQTTPEAPKGRISVSRRRLEQLAERYDLIETEVQDFVEGVRQGIARLPSTPERPETCAEWIGPQPEIILWLVRGFVHELDTTLGILPKSLLGAIRPNTANGQSHAQVELGREDSELLYKPLHDWHHDTVGDPLTIFMSYRSMLTNKTCTGIPVSAFLASAARMEQSTQAFSGVFRKWLKYKLSGSWDHTVTA